MPTIKGTPIRILASATLVCAAVMAGSAPGLAAGEPVNTGYFGGVAIMGYDAVAYFTEGRPMRGSEEFAYDWLGTPWYFASAKHRELFVADPAKYAPQYGGFCVGEIAFNGTTINIDPDAWAIIDGKLYLGYSRGFVEDEFRPNAAEFIANAETNWPAIKDMLAKEGTY
jgi:YHS domain-containing protein